MRVVETTVSSEQPFAAVPAASLGRLTPPKGTLGKGRLTACPPATQVAAHDCRIEKQAVASCRTTTRPIPLTLPCGQCRGADPLVALLDQLTPPCGPCESALPCGCRIKSLSSCSVPGLCLVHDAGIEPANFCLRNRPLAIEQSLVVKDALALLLRSLLRNGIQHALLRQALAGL